jgi:hypothetical protein
MKLRDEVRGLAKGCPACAFVAALDPETRKEIDSYLGEDRGRPYGASARLFRVLARGGLDMGHESEQLNLSAWRHHVRTHRR